MDQRPNGVVTFLFTDIVHSALKWDREPDAMRRALAEHDAILRRAIEDRDGWLFKHTGDGVIAAFATPRGAVDAAAAAQRELPLPVRMGISTGEVEFRDDDYFGPALNHAERAMAAGHGGQILVTAATAGIVAGVELIDLGSHRLRDLAQEMQLYQVGGDGLASDFPPLRTEDVVPGNLYRPANALLGREAHLAEVGKLLAEARLLTLSGVGGVGKTRFALELAAEAQGGYPDGVWLVELAAVSDPAATGHAVAAVLGVTQRPGKSIQDSVVTALAGRRMLLLIDNCEHLIDAVAALVDKIVSHCADVTVLVTSRESLMIEGERIWAVPSLSFREGEASPAVALFAERARAVASNFNLSDDAEAVAEICRRLDGIPLAIELAAARIRAISPGQIRDRLGDRFRLLTGGSRQALERHHTLRHAVQWSFDLLTPAEATLLCRAGVFSGGFDLTAAEAVCCGGDVLAEDLLDLIDSLVRKSLMSVERPAGQVRYALLETIRQFGEEQLAAMVEDDDVRARHGAYFAAEADRHFEIWCSPDQHLAYEWLEREMGNIRAGFRRAVDAGDVDTAVRLAAGTGEMARFCLRDEAAHWAAEVVDVARAAKHPRLVVLLTWACSNAWAGAQLEAAKAYGEEAISLVGDEDVDPWVWAFIDLAFIAAYEGEVERALDYISRGAAQPTDEADLLCLALKPTFLIAAGRQEEAEALVCDNQAKIEATRIPSLIAVHALALGKTFAVSDPHRALASLEHGLEISRATRNRMWVNVLLPDAVALQARIGDPIAALVSFRDMITVWRSSADLWIFSLGMGSLVVLFDQLERWDEAATMRGTLDSALQADALIQDLPEAIAHLREVLGDDVYESHYHHGAAMNVHQATDYAYEQVNLALSRHEDGEP